MTDKLDRFSKRARHALTLAQEGALRLSHDRLEPEHILLGLARVEGSMAAKVLREFGAAPERIIHSVERAVERGHNMLHNKPKLTEETKRVIELSVDEARLMEAQHIGTEHFLLGLLRQEGSRAAQVLHELGITLDAARTRIRADEPGHSGLAGEDDPTSSQN